MSRQDCKVFVGGLSWETTDAKLRGFFENYGTVHEAFVSYDRHTGRPRGFGFVVFEDPGVADKVVSLQHTIDRREVSLRTRYWMFCLNIFFVNFRGTDTPSGVENFFRDAG